MEESSHSDPGEHFPIVAVGASAGGYEAFSALLRALPADSGMAYIFIQHLDPSHESIVADLLARNTGMPVKEASEGTPIEPDHVYIIPPNRSLIVRDGKLGVIPRETRARHMPIDQFMRSVAEIHGNRAIGVVLSGNATDGTLGLKAIKAEGGLTFAQDPATARFDGMPRSAIAANCVDFVLPIERIAREIANLSKHPYVNQRGPESGVLPPNEEQDVDRIFVLLKKATGVDFKFYKHTTIRRRISRRMVVHKIDRVGEYVKLLQDTPGEIEALYQDLLIKVTRFFRDVEVFDFLKSTVFPQMFENRSNDAPVRIWVPGCSTGEEVYSIAICLLEFMGDLSANPSVQLFATDVSDTAINVAREGRYVENIAQDVSPERLRRFFVRVDGGYQISKPIRDLCIFARQNMTSDPPFSKLDLISCRNVLIYLDSRLQKRVIPLFHYALKPTGYLMLGSSETVGSFTELFSLVDKRHKIYAKKAALSRMHVDFATSGYPTDQLESRMASKEPPHDFENWRVQEAQRDADRIILTKFGAAGVVVDHNMDIIQFRGETSRFLAHTPGEPSLNLFKMAREGMALELRSLIHEARTGGTALKRSVAISEGGHSRMIRVEVAPLQGQAGSDKGSFFLVLFEDDESRAQPATAAPESSPADLTPSSEVLERRIQQLSTELTATKQHLQSIIEEQEATNEELQSANEEVLSSNEELQSINEELETAKEELQSTNEELTTVNEELQNRNLELSQVNNDLTNLLSSVSIPILMLGSDLRIRRFTPLAEKLLSLIPTDVGRPISDIKPRMNTPELETLVGEVIDTVTVKELEVQDREGRWYSMRIRPYKTRENKIDGAVIALVDIDVLKRSLVQVKESVQFLDAALQILREPVLILDHNFRIKKANAAFSRICHVTGSSLENSGFFDIGHGQWNIPVLKKSLSDLAVNSAGVDTITDLAIEQPSGGSTRKLRVNARRVAIEGEKETKILLSIEDVT